MRWRKLKCSCSTTTTYALPTVGAFEVLHWNYPALFGRDYLGTFLDCIQVVGLHRVTWSRCVKPTSGQLITIRTVIRPNRKIPRGTRPHPKQQWTLRNSHNKRIWYLQCNLDEGILQNTSFLCVECGTLQWMPRSRHDNDRLRTPNVTRPPCFWWHKAGPYGIYTPKGRTSSILNPYLPQYSAGVVHHTLW
jgi:hypothetical protein